MQFIVLSYLILKLAFIMTESYTSFMNSIDLFFQELQKKFDLTEKYDGERQDKINDHIKSFLFEKWGETSIKDLTDIGITIKNHNSILNYFRLHAINEIFTNIKEIELFRDLKKHTKFDFDYIVSISSSTYEYFRLIYFLGNQQLRDLKQELVNIFLRLTQYPAGTFVPLTDLIRKDVNEKGIYSKSGIEGIFYTLIKMKAPFPAPYYPNLAAFEKTDSLATILRELDQSFSNYSNEKEI